MKTLKRMLVLLITAVMFLCFPMQVSAEGGGNAASPDSGGLIAVYSYSCSSGSKRILINASVTATDTMAKIGFKDIKIQQSTSGTGGWSNYFEPSDQMAYDADFYSLTNFLIAVPGGYYYRFELTNYAKEYGWIFPASQSISVTSNVVWVS